MKWESKLVWNTSRFRLIWNSTLWNLEEVLFSTSAVLRCQRNVPWSWHDFHRTSVIGISRTTLNIWNEVDSVLASLIFFTAMASYLCHNIRKAILIAIRSCSHLFLKGEATLKSSVFRSFVVKTGLVPLYKSDIIETVGFSKGYSHFPLLW